MIDVKDQWPALFIEPFPRFLKPFAKLAFSPYYYFAHRAFKDASSFSSMSPGYLNWMSSFSGRPLHAHDIVVPLTAPHPQISDTSLAIAEAWWQAVGVSSNTKRRFCFVGSFMSVFDFTGIRNAAERFQNEGIDCQFVICGDGGSANEIRSIMSGLRNVIFPGWIDEHKKAALAKISVGALIPYKNIENFTLNTPNKVLDAFALGLPIITTLTGEVQNLIESEGVGFSCNQRTGRNLYDAMRVLLDNSDLQFEMSKRALDLFERKYSYNKVYGELVFGLERMFEK
jgi:glycosyltransferase involved in cell wall biosynthesis